MKARSARLPVAVFAAFAIAASACSAANDTVEGDERTYDAAAVAMVPVPPTDASFSDDVAASTFTQVYSLVIAGPPSCTGCHANPGASANLDLSSQSVAYASLVGQHVTSSAQCASQTELLVTPGDSTASLLFLKVTNPPCGSRMPLGGTPLTTDQVQVIEGWINAGAQDN